MSHDHSHAPTPGAFDEMDPHGYGSHGQHASHVIVGPMQLRLTLTALFIFTFLTVAFAWSEQWAVDTFHITLPWWVNVVGAMSIAVVKALLVMAIFMQLKYDNPMNTILMAFTFAALAVFLTFSGLDLFNRSAVYDWKSGPVVAGGTGNGVKQSAGKPIVIAARERHLADLEKRLGSKEAAQAEFAKQEAEALHHGGTHAAHAEPDVNTGNRSRPRLGRTDALSTAAPTHGEAAHGGEPAP